LFSSRFEESSCAKNTDFCIKKSSCAANRTAHDSNPQPSKHLWQNRPRSVQQNSENALPPTRHQPSPTPIPIAVDRPSVF
jgi:hypothetical protein